MTAILALIIQFLPYLTQAAKTIPEIIDFVQQLKTIFARKAIWTTEAAAAFDASLEAMRSDPDFISTDTPPTP
jgi:hypothetical protein